MEGNDERCRQSKEDVDVQPVPRVSLLHQPGPALAQRVEEYRKENKHAEEPKLQANGSAGFEQCVLGREGALRGVEGVVIEAVNGERKQQRDGDHVSADQPKAMPVAAARRRTHRANWSDYG